MEKDGTCLAIYNSCTYGVSCTQNAINLTLLNGSAYAAHPIGDRPLVDKSRHIPYIEQGNHFFGFRIGVCDRDVLTTMAQEFVEKPYALNVFPHGEGRSECETITLDNEAISLHVFKRSKKGGYIIRLFNNGYRAQKCNISVFGKSKKLSFGRFEIKTLKYDGEKITESKEIEI
jgi:alpha-mannosidase